ncbi:MAG TPA: hypothetical protein PK573_11810 [Spirochaetota bacterium]|nr:hypothetical protein [Spirochaetota bacterium]HRZ25339.1 hypothetical protein [Spirochaetota bacterium]HSA14603.1 hypothetical protein [Spirochaetota bacterium]
MKEYHIKSYSYRCSCGYTLTVYADCGVPQEIYKCRKCGHAVKREGQ